jgi:3',5'-cyclic-AMP phosphodiesterase
MSIHLSLAQISDIHLGHREDQYGMVLPTEAGRLLDAAVAGINAAGPRDAVLVTGDLIDNGVLAELDDVATRLDGLRAPWYGIPGNHDIAHPPNPALLDRRSFYQRLAATPGRAAAYAGSPDRGSWTTVLRPGARLVALDSNVAGDWGGRISDAQLEWLEATLAAATEPLVVLMVHHPLHEVFGGWVEPAFAGQDWNKFFCANRATVNAILDRSPRVRLVLSGHDHVNSHLARPGRLHLSAPGLGSYPLAYRLIEVEGQDDRWTVTWQTAQAADPATRRRAGDQLASTEVARAYDPANPRRLAAVFAGGPDDQCGAWRAPPEPPDGP